MLFISSWFEQAKQSITAWPPLVFILISLACGVALVGWGYSLFRIWLTGFGLICGYMAGSWLCTKFEIVGTFAFVVITLIALAGAVFFWLALKTSIFIAAFFFGVYLTRQFLVSVFAWDQEIAPWVGGLMIAVLAVIFMRFFIILATAISGANLVVDALYSLISNQNTGSWIQYLQPIRHTLPALLFILTLAIAVFGFLYQFRRTHRGRNIRLHGNALRSR